MTTAKRSPIPLRKKLKPIFLAEDYGAGQYHWCSIHAENLVDAQRKAQFLQDARRYLRSVGEHLRPAGFLEQYVSVNASGIAASGEVYGAFYRPGIPRFLRIEVSTEMVEGLTPRDDQVTLLAHWEEPRSANAPPRSGPNCWLNPCYSSAVTARCLQAVLAEEGRNMHYWWWKDDSTLRDGLMDEGQEALVRSWHRHQRAKRRAQSWQPIPPGGESSENVCLREDYTAQPSSTALSSLASLDVPHLRPVVFLDRDLHRDGRAYLEALGVCLAAYGFTRKRIVLQEAGRFVWGDYLKSGPGGSSVQVRVKIGPIDNHNVLTRHDHVVVYTCAVPVGWEGDEEDEPTHPYLYQPTHLAASRLAQLLATRFCTAKEPDSEDVATQKEKTLS
jgi:hypothetical protein